MARGSRSIVRPPNPSTAPIRTCRVATTDQECWPGAPGWRAKQARRSYKRRSICECIHARWRNWDLPAMTVRGIDKVKAVMLWYALANNR